MSEELEPVSVFYEKGDFVFGKCLNELAWPAKVTKADRDRDLYTVKFIKSNSTATLQSECIFEFSEQIIVEVLASYDHNDKPSAKVKQAIAASRKELQNARKKIQDKPIIKKEPKIKSEQQSVETLQSASNSKAKKAKGLKKLSKKQPQPCPSNQIKVESDLANQYVLENTCGQQTEPNPVLHESDPKQDEDEIAYLSDDEILSEPLNSNNQQQSIEKKEDDAHQNALQNAQVSSHTEMKEVNTEESKPTSVSTPTNETETIPAIGRHEESEAKMGTEMEVQHSQAIHIFEVEDRENHDIRQICLYLNKMTAYLTGRESAPLNRDEKLDLAMLLQAHRKFYYPNQMLQAMLDFVKAFDFKLKEQRRNCIIEYVKIKERMETVCFLRAQLCYDETTIKILDRYCLKQNLFS